MNYNELKYLDKKQHFTKQLSKPNLPEIQGLEIFD